MAEHHHPMLVPALLRVLARLGLDGAALWDQAGFHRDRAGSATPADYFEFLAFLAREVDPVIGPRIAGVVSLEDFELLGERVRFSSSVREAFHALAAYHDIWQQGPRLSVEDLTDGVLVRWNPAPDYEPSGVAVDSQETLFILARLPSLLGAGPSPRATITMPTTLPTVPAWARDIEVCQGASWSVYHPAVVADQTLETSRPIARALDAAAARSLAEVDVGVAVVSRVEAALHSRPHSHDLASVARRLGTSRRTLQRQLARAGTDFRTLRDRVSLSVARGVLRHPDTSIEETAHRVGFSTAPAFVRAFRRWTGTTPRRWRDREAS